MNFSFPKFLKIVALLMGTLVLMFNISISKNNKYQNIDLNTLFKINQVNAECIPYDITLPGVLPGRCSVWDECFFDAFGEQCSFGRG